MASLLGGVEAPQLQLQSEQRNGNHLHRSTMIMPGQIAPLRLFHTENARHRQTSITTHTRRMVFPRTLARPTRHPVTSRTTQP